MQTSESRFRLKTSKVGPCGHKKAPCRRKASRGRKMGCNISPSQRSVFRSDRLDPAFLQIAIPDRMGFPEIVNGGFRSRMIDRNLGIGQALQSLSDH